MGVEMSTVHSPLVAQRGRDLERVCRENPPILPGWSCSENLEILRYSNSRQVNQNCYGKLDLEYFHFV